MSSSTARLQRAPVTSKSQPRAHQRQSQRTRRSGRTDEDNEDEDVENESPNADANGDVEMGIDGTESEINRKASELVRLALFTEHKRTPLRREDITKRVLGSNGRTFNHVFNRAQHILQQTFGMELAELPTRAALETDANAGEDELNEARKAASVRRKATATGSKTYILRSVLHPLIREHAAQTDEQILEEESADVPDGEDDDDENYSYGSIISWSHSDHLGPIGLLNTILALILTSGRVLSDMELRAHLKRLGLSPASHILFPIHSTHRSLSIEQYFSILIRQGYLDRLQVGGDTSKKGMSSAGKRGRVSLVQEENAGNGMAYEWRWGPRAQSEFSEKGVAEWVAEFMIGEVGEEEEEEDDGGNERRGGGARREGVEKKLERMLKGIERATGGMLAGVN